MFAFLVAINGGKPADARQNTSVCARNRKTSHSGSVFRAHPTQMAQCHCRNPAESIHPSEEFHRNATHVHVQCSLNFVNRSKFSCEIFTDSQNALKSSKARISQLSVNAMLATPSESSPRLAWQKYVICPTAKSVFKQL